MKIVKTWHYVTYHEKEVDWPTVIRIIFSVKAKRKGRNFFQYTSKGKKNVIYVLAKREGEYLKVINAKRKRR